MAWRLLDEARRELAHRSKSTGEKTRNVRAIGFGWFCISLRHSRSKFRKSVNIRTGSCRSSYGVIFMVGSPVPGGAQWPSSGWGNVQQREQPPGEAKICGKDQAEDKKELHDSVSHLLLTETADRCAGDDKFGVILQSRRFPRDDNGKSCAITADLRSRQPFKLHRGQECPRHITRGECFRFPVSRSGVACAVR